ncbi:MAG TPA: polysaccharide deacetylase family protein [Phycisphaerae bacterium]|nr:polysaccharide deacetylase family protein [Phycisphaerae bacterium]HRY69805.1 polysaccharide deacetylase family protein [Phycisphaerae bacterium]HSA25362.1 polysaccharide deacetylase family protein [Phycisphaerae bacterium]
MRHKRIVAFGGCVLVAMAGCLPWPEATPSSDTAKPVGLIQLIEFEDIQGLRNWGYELQQRGMKALAFIQKNMLDEYPTEIKWLADQGHEIAGGYAELAMWDVAYETQLQIMTETKTLVEQVTGKPMRVFGSKYFAYDENTLKAADALGLDYILARGTSDVEVIVYDPDEYECDIISVSNVTFEDMGRGSLCDYSLWARGSTAEEFKQVIEQSIAKMPKRIMFASHTYLGGMKQAWWDVYDWLLDAREIRWAADFDEWLKPENGVCLRLPMSLIPINREVQYTTPAPTTPLDELADVDQMYNPCSVP